MSGDLRLSHLLIRVADLPAAVADYQALGFTVVWGSDPAKAHNALVYFERGPFLELFTPPPMTPEAVKSVSAIVGVAAAERFRLWAEFGEGLVEYALETDDADLEATVRALGSARVPVSPILPTSRVRPDGTRLTWTMAFPDDLDLPFVMSAYTPPDAQPDSARRHANGARRLTALKVSHPAPADLEARLARYMGRAPSDDGIRIIEGPAYALPSLVVEGLSNAIPASRARGVTFDAA